MKDKTPDFLITTRDDATLRVVSFSELYPLKETIVSLTMLWDTNSYHVNIDKRFFIINGGRALRIEGIEEHTPVELVYARRNKLEIALTGDMMPGEKVQSYLLGFKYETSAGMREELLHIQGGGQFWARKKSR